MHISPQVLLTAPDAPTPTLPRKRERERAAFYGRCWRSTIDAKSIRDGTHHAHRMLPAPSPACGGGLGWGHLRCVHAVVRTQGPITPGLEIEKRPQPQCQKVT